MKVKIYSTPLCPWCDAAKDFLNSLKIPFEEIDVSVDEKAAQFIIEKTGQTGVPVIEIDGKIIIGFDKPLLEEILGLNRPENKQNSA
ncbi:MAG: glutaredoxin domain-containing protein [Candidatus Pacebacteria bacterium]|nr:glutaredoxin domain-containing protein [Candidatus Paceibacterota bacterium]